ncbi:MAG TPA: ribonuclease Y, partial [Rugosimonospora sp.]|nr:ribonuclease Y [Rugosimonospora sp.]
MTGLVVVLVGVVVVLAVLVVFGLVLLLRTLRPLQERVPVAPAGRQAAEDPAYLAERDRQEQSLAALRATADEASSAIEESRVAASAARSDAAAAKAEANAARAEAQRVLAAAHSEADTILE